MENGWDFGEADVIIENFEIFYSLNDIFVYLKSMNANLDGFSEARNTDYPL
jgi:hypothetical protein